MAPRRIVIDRPTTHGQRSPASVSVQVDDNAPIGPLVATLAAQCGYPLLDSFGLPVTYRLYSVPEHRPIPNAKRFADVRFRSDSHFVLEAEAATYETAPMPGEALIPALPRQHQPALPGLSRRSLLTVGGTLALVSVLGLGAGMTTALAQHTLDSRHPVTVPLPAMAPTTPAPLTLTLQATFTRHQHTIRSVTWFPDEIRLASGDNDGLVFVWQANGTVLHTLRFPDPVRGVAWSPDGIQLAVGAGHTVSFFDAQTAHMLGESADQHKHTAPVTAIGWTQTAPPLAISVSEDTRAVVWNGQTHQPQLLFQRHAASIEALATHTDLVATASVGGVVRIWSALDGQEVHGPYAETNHALRSVAFSAAGQLAIGGDDAIVRVWNDGRICMQQTSSASGLQCLDTPHHLTGHTQPVRAVAFSPDSMLLATGGDDNLLLLWSIPDLTLLSTQTLPEAITALAWSASGRWLAVASGPQVSLWLRQP